MVNADRSGTPDTCAARVLDAVPGPDGGASAGVTARGLVIVLLSTSDTVVCEAMV